MQLTEAENFDLRLPPLGKRLTAIANMVSGGVKIADIGTDHAYIPVYLVLTRRASTAIATDINPEPLMRAKKTINEYAPKSPIELRLCDGLTDVAPHEADTIIIAGLGGDTIAEIIQNALWLYKSEKTLILQPMSRAAELRQFLIRSSFSIISEEIVRDGEHLYTIMLVRYGEEREYPPVYAYIGETLNNKAPLSSEYVQHQLNRLVRKRNGLLNGKAPDMSEIIRLTDIIAKLDVIIAFKRRKL